MQQKIISKRIALGLCEEIRIKNQKKRWPFYIGKMQCHFCWRFGKKAYNAGNPNKLCVFGSDDNRGCWQVNKLFDKRFSDEKSSYPSGDMKVLATKSKGYRFPIGFESLKNETD